MNTTSRQQHKKAKNALRRLLRKNISARYPIEKSPLWRLTSRHRLVELFGLSIEEWDNLTKQPSYNRFDEKARDGKEPRHIQEPVGQTQTLHYRFVTLLDRVERPNFLHSATKRRSHITNAEAHRGAAAVACTDISKFFENTTEAHIKAFLHRDLGWAHDLAREMAQALAADGHLPTGSAVSPLLSYFAHRRLFREVERLCEASGVTLTLYVDDITISGTNATKALLYRIKGVLKSAGLRTHKERYAPPGGAIVITGSVPTSSSLKLRNKHRKEITTLLAQLEAGDYTVISRLRGKIASAKLVDPAGAAPFERRYAEISALQESALRSQIVPTAQ